MKKTPKSRALLDTMGSGTRACHSLLLPHTEEELHARARKASLGLKHATMRGEKSDLDFGDALREVCHSLVKSGRDDVRFIVPLDEDENQCFYRVERHDGEITFEKIEYSVSIGHVDEISRAEVAVA
jgi:hypothetical protein